MNMPLVSMNRRRRIGGAATPVFSPSALFALAEPGVWYDPSDLTTLFQDTAGTQPVTTPGQTVARVNDKSGRGNNATQATLASRPTYGIVPLGGRRNLLTRTEEFENAAWVKTNTTVTANAGTAPNGTATADLVYPSSSGTARYVNAQLTGTTGATYSTSIRLKAAGIGFAYIYNVLGNQLLYVNLTTGVTSNVGSNINGLTSSIDANDWVTVSFNSVLTSGATATLYVGPSDASGSTSVTASGTNGILIWGAQLETGSSATAYQRVGSAFDVTEAGVASLSYLSFDGVDDSLVTPTVTPGIDKAQVFAGVRKLANGNNSCIVELSASASSNNGALYILTGRQLSGPAPAYTALSRGTVIATVDTADLYNAPIDNLLTLLGDISGDRATLRVNGTQVAQSTADQGTGNYLAYPLYIGRRGGTTLPFNGNIFSLIVRFGTNLDAGTITSTETWVNGKTGAYA